MNNIIGIGGTNGAGKDTLANWLAENKGWLFISVTDILRNELKKRGQPIEREYLRQLSAAWRREHGMGVLIDMAMRQFDSKKYKGLVISSLRNPGEADRVHELGGKVVWIDSDPKLRYERVKGRNRSTEDDKTFKQFLSEEEAEMNRSGDMATLDMSSVKQKADIFIQNDTHTLDEFKALVSKSLGFDSN